MFEVKIEPEAVNKIVADAIIKSALGQHLQDAIDKAIKDVLTGWDSPVKKLVNQHVNECVREVLETQHKESIIASLQERLTKEHIQTIIDASVDKAVELLKSDRY